MNNFTKWEDVAEGIVFDDGSGELRQVYQPAEKGEGFEKVLLRNLSTGIIGKAILDWDSNWTILEDNKWTDDEPLEPDCWD